jgi:hypothetical protein
MGQSSRQVIRPHVGRLALVEQKVDATYGMQNGRRPRIGLFDLITYIWNEPLFSTRWPFCPTVYF